VEILPHRRWWRLALAAWLALAIVAGMAFSAYLGAHDVLARMSPDTQDVTQARAVLADHHDGPINVLLLGSDRRLDQPELGARSDTMILARLDPAAGALTFLSIPRDLQVQVEGLGRAKINAAYAQAGPAGAITAVRQTLGVPVHHYVEVNFQGFFRLIQHLGGAWVQVDRRYFNPEGTGWAPIDLHPGYQRLNGNQALQFVRFRHTDSDFTRAQRQQLVLQSLRETADGNLGILDVPELLEIAGENVRTDVRDVAVLGSLLKTALSVDPGRVRRVRFEADASSPTADAASIIRIRTAFLEPPAPREEAVARPELVVANAGAGLGAAERTARMLRAGGWAARGIGDASRAGVAWQPGIYGRSAEDRRALAILGTRLDLPVRPITGDVAHRAVIVLGAEQALRGGSARSSLVTTGRRPDPQCPIVPRALPRGASISESEGVRRYTIFDEAGSHRACAVTVFDPAAGGWWQLQYVAAADPPLLRGARAQGPYRILGTDGAVRLIAWRTRDGWAWVHNTLDLKLSAGQLRLTADAARAG